MTRPHIDLRVWLPIVREQYDSVTANLGKCRYTAPCVIGFMLPKEVRGRFDRASIIGGSKTIGGLIEAGSVTTEPGQGPLLRSLQASFDSGRRESFETALRHAETALASAQDQAS